MATSCGGDEDRSIGSTLLWREARQKRRDRVCGERLAGANGRAAAWVRLSCGDAAGSGAQLRGQAEWTHWDGMKSSSGAEADWLAASVRVCPRDT